MQHIWSKAGVAGGCFLFFWSAITLLFDGVLGVTIGLSLLALTYRPTPGVVTRSDVVIKHDSDGDTARPIVEYDYSVAGLPYHGQRHSYDAFGGPVAIARRIAKQYRPGDPVTVYYNPLAPSWSVLYRGLTPLDQMVTLFMTPFNVVMIGGWLACGAASRGARLGRPAMGLKVYEDGPQTAVRFFRVSPLAAVLIAALATSFPLIFVCAIGMQFTDSTWLPAASWGIVLVAALFAWRWARQSGSLLVIDHLRGTVDYLPGDGTGATASLPVDQVTIGVGRVETTDSEGDKSVSYPVSLNYRQEKSEVEIAAPLMTCYDEAEANRLRDWLTMQFGAPALKSAYP